MIAALIVLSILAFSGPERLPVVVSTDCGAEVDDQWAITHLALSPRIDLKGIVTTHAPGLKPIDAAKVARDLFEKFGRQPPPILAGSSEPLGADGKPRDNAGVRFLLAAAKGRSGDDRLTVIMIGAATDVASALLLDPSWKDRVTIVAMAFDGWPEGGDPWNVKNDVKAWQVVMASSVPLIVGDARVTRRHLLHTPETARKAIGGDSLGSKYLCAILERWIADNPKLVEEASGKPGHWPIWDEVTVAYLLGMTTSEERPRPVLRDDRTLDHTQPHGTIRWITTIDSDRLWADLAGQL